MRSAFIGVFKPVRLFTLASVLVLGSAACGGSNKPQGTYHHTAGGAMTLDFKGDKVTVTLAGEAKTLDYKVDGDKITIVNPAEGDIVLTRNSDGSLNSNIGTFAKQK
jgi:uncharacterized lipoprotein YehR (DUF1307 family)